MNDQDTTRQLPPPPPAPGDDASRPKRLVRTHDRMLAGVAGGLGRYFDVDPVIFRIGFVVTVFFGGLGLLAYLALALFVPSEAADGEPEPAPIERSRTLAIAAGIGLAIVALSWGVFDGPGWGGAWFLGPPLLLLALIAAAIYFIRPGGEPRGRPGLLASILFGLIALGALAVLAFGAAWAGATGHGAAVAAGLVVIGVLLVLASFSGGARWLIAPAIAVAVPLGLVVAADISFGGGIGERIQRPTTIAALPDEGYELGIGRLAVDLRELDWNRRTVVDLSVDLGIGEAVVAVPADVCVTHELKSRAGLIRVAGEEQDGIDVESNGNVGVEATPRLELTGEVDLGVLRVINDDDATIDEKREHFGFDDEDEAGLREALAAACEEAPAEPRSRDSRADSPKRERGG